MLEVLEDDKRKNDVYTFVHRRNFSYLTYATIVTDVEFAVKGIRIKQKGSKFAFVGRYAVDQSLDFESIKEVVIKKTMEPWDLVFSIVCLVMVVASPWWLLGALIFAKSGYGRRMMIYTASERVVIPCNEIKRCMAFVEMLKQKNPEIMVRG